MLRMIPQHGSGVTFFSNIRRFWQFSAFEWQKIRIADDYLWAISLLEILLL